MTNGEAIQIIKSISKWEYWQNDTLEAFILAIKALETLDGIKHKVYRNEMCDRAGKCYDYFGYNCTGCNGSKMKGEWIKDYSHYKCSNCGKEAPYIYPNEHERFVEIKSKFCPNCGAYMRGNKNGDDK